MTENIVGHVWIVIRDSGGDVEVDVFTNVDAARLHAKFFTDAIVREESVASEAWAHEAVEPDEIVYSEHDEVSTIDGVGRVAKVEDDSIRVYFEDSCTFEWYPRSEIEHAHVARREG